MQKRPSLDPRIDAAIILKDVMKGKQTSTELLDYFLSFYPPEKTRDGALLHEIVMGVLRSRILLTKILETYIKSGFDKMIPILREIVLVMAYQMLFLDRVPKYAVVSGAVESVRRLLGESKTGFVNAVGRALAKGGFTRSDLSSFPVSVRWSITDVIRDAVEGVVGLNADEHIWMALNQKAPITFRVNRNRVDREMMMDEISRLGIEVNPTQWSDDGIVMKSVGDNEGIIRRLKRLGLIPYKAVPQDEASQLVVQVLEPKNNERIFDLCAGRGIKTSHCLAIAPRARVVAIDKDKKRLEKCVDLCRSIGFTSLQTMAEDVLNLTPERVGYADAIILDAPCSGLGTIRRRPEVRYLRDKDDLVLSKSLQVKLLEQGLSLLRPGGRIVYSVCSFAYQEGRQVVEDVLEKQRGFRILPIKLKGRFLNDDGSILTLPWQDDMDGFYICAIMKVMV